MFKCPSSSYKYSVQNMGSINSRIVESQITAVSLKPSGFSSKPESKGRSYMRPTESSAHKLTAVRGLQDGYKVHMPDQGSVPWPEAPRTAFVPEDFKRSAIAYKVSHLTDSESIERPPCRGGENASGLRPPSRHKPSPKAVGLELPPRPITPPDTSIENFFDRTWSFGQKRGEEEPGDDRGLEKGGTYVPRDNGRPKSQKKLMGSLEKSESLFAWDDRSKLRTSNEKPSKKPESVDSMPPVAEKHPKEIPIIVTKTGIPIEGSESVFIRRRLQTADISSGKGWTPKLMGSGKTGASGRNREAETNVLRGSYEGDHYGYFE